MCILVLNSIPLQSTLRSSYQRGILLRHLLLSLFAETGVYKRRTKANSFSFFFRIIFQKNCLSSVVPRSSCKPYLNSRCWPGTSLQLRLMRGVISNANDINLFLMIFTRVSLHCKLRPVQYTENTNMVYSTGYRTSPL